MEKENQYDIEVLQAGLEVENTLDLFLGREFDERQISVVDEMKKMVKRITNPNIGQGRRIYVNRLARLSRVLSSGENLLLLQTKQTLDETKNIFKRGNLKAMVESRKQAVEIIGIMQEQIADLEIKFPLENNSDKEK